MVLGLALTLSRFINSRGKMRVFYAVPVVIILGAILLTHSRGGLIALMTVMFLYFLVSSRRKVLAIVLAVVCCGVVVIAAPGRMTNFDTQEQSANSRFHFWNEGIHQLVGHPVLGIGYGKFPDVNDGFVAHNSFVNCFAEQGLIGYFFWMGCIYFAFRQRSKGIPEPPAPESAATELIGARIALAGYLSAGFWITRESVPCVSARSFWSGSWSCASNRGNGRTKVPASFRS
jgi:O-antigen ligase